MTNKLPILSLVLTGLLAASFSSQWLPKTLVKASASQQSPARTQDSFPRVFGVAAQGVYNADAATGHRIFQVSQGDSGSQPQSLSSRTVFTYLPGEFGKGIFISVEFPWGDPGHLSVVIGYHQSESD